MKEFDYKCGCGAYSHGTVAVRSLVVVGGDAAGQVDREVAAEQEVT